MTKKSGRTNFDSVLQMIPENPEKVFDKYARMLSDLQSDRLARLRTVLSGMRADLRAVFFRKMAECIEESYEFDFTPIARLGIKDSDGEVRAAAITILAFDNSRETGREILLAAKTDPFEKAQIAAIRILGQYQFDLVLEEPIPVPEELLHEALGELIESKNGAVRRAAVIANANSDSDREKELIRGFLAGNDREELIAALRAIRIGLCEDWNRNVLELMRYEDEDVSIAAMQAAGALEMRAALPALYEIISRFDSVPEDVLLSAVDAVAAIGDEGSLDVLETLGEAAVDMDEEITDVIDDCIDTLNMSIHFDSMAGDFGLDDEDDDEYSDDEDEDFFMEDGNSDDADIEPKMASASFQMLDAAIEAAKDRCLSALEEKIPYDLEDDKPFDDEEDEDEHDCCEGHHHHHHHHDNPLEGMDLSRFRILDDLEMYESAADRDEDEDELWASFEDMAEEDLDAESLADFITRLENLKAQKPQSRPGKKKGGEKSGK